MPRTATAGGDGLYDALVEAQGDLDLVVIVARDGRPVFWNGALPRLTGYSPEELAALPSVLDLVAPEERPALEERLSAAPQGPFSATVLRRDGERADFEFALRRGRSGDVVVIARDVSERGRAQRELERHALHDALTGLPNRTLLLDRLEQALLAAKRLGMSVGFMVVDLDRFKEVNNTAGHQVGDALLKEVALRIQSRLRDSDTLARLGGDEFGLVLPGVDATGAVLVARKILKILERPFVIAGQAFDVAASLGIAHFPDHGEDRDALLRNADVAMYAAKRSGSGFNVYASEQDTHSSARLALAAGLRVAIERGELELHYQPEVSLRTGAVQWLEALVRWRHPRRGLLPPSEFVPLAESSGLVKLLTEWVLATALRACAAWQAAGRELGVGVNLSMRNLLDPQLPERIAALLAETGAPAPRLGLEITENVLMADPEHVLQTLQRLRGMGVSIYIDDFGTGYSSLAYLHRLPVNGVKIDRSFTMRLRTDKSGEAIVRATIDLAHTLGFEVVAEGVEDRESLELLKALGCDMAQGYHLGRPLPSAEIERWLAAEQKVS